MLGSRRVSLVFLLLLCAVSALAQEQPAADIADIVESEQRALHQAEEQEEATEHAPISHDKAPAALEDVDEYKGEGYRDESEVGAEHGNFGQAMSMEHVASALTTQSAAYAIAAPVQALGSENLPSSPDCHATPGAEACSGHGMCVLNSASDLHFCECTEGWFGPHCQCGEQPDQCTESDDCHWCGALSLCLTSKDECEAGELALHGQSHHNVDTFPQQQHAGAGAEETAVLPEEDAEVDAMQHQEMAYEEQGASKGNNGLVYSVIVLLLLVGVAAAAVWYWKNRHNFQFPFSLNNNRRDSSGYDHL